jgi:salicylate hydroxylase
MNHNLVIVGAGIGGLALALGLAKKNTITKILEQSQALHEIGAGLQLGANSTRRLSAWGLMDALQSVAFFPKALIACNGENGRILNRHELGQTYEQRYGAPYVTVTRSDLHQLLLASVMREGKTDLMLGHCIQNIDVHATSVVVKSTTGQETTSSLLIGADGLRSTVRQCLLDDAQPQFSGHVAYRSLVPMRALPMALRLHDVYVWMGAAFHVVHYPVSGGEFMNIVVLTEGLTSNAVLTWNQDSNNQILQQHLASSCPHIRSLIDAVSEWRLWPLYARPPINRSMALTKDAVALIGDAAHPMLPYFAQGASMAIEDSYTLAECFAQRNGNTKALHDYAQQRWRRVSMVQKKSIKNGKIFHSRGIRRVGRDIALQLCGRYLMEQSWLYRY